MESYSGLDVGVCVALYDIPSSVFCFCLDLNWLLGHFPRLILLLPHFALIGIILASYPYTPNTPAPADSSVNWQANLQAIQNLMGFIYVQQSDIVLFLPKANPNP